MSNLILSTSAYLYDFILLMLYFSGCLGRRFSRMVTFLGTVACWVAFCCFKLLPVYQADYNPTLPALFQLLVLGFYLCFFFGSSLPKKLLAALLQLATLSLLEFFTMRLLYTVIQPGEPVPIDSPILALGTLIMIPLALLVCVFNYDLWKLFESRQWKWTHSRLQWICLLLPLGQGLLLTDYIRIYLNAIEQIRVSVLLGILLSMLADAGMFFLLEEAAEQSRLEEALRLQKRLYQREKYHYEELMQTQQETAKLRHDYQNYLLMLQELKKEDTP